MLFYYCYSSLEGMRAFAPSLCLRSTVSFHFGFTSFPLPLPHHHSPSLLLCFFPWICALSYKRPGLLVFALKDGQACGSVEVEGNKNTGWGKTEFSCVTTFACSLLLCTKDSGLFRIDLLLCLPYKGILWYALALHTWRTAALRRVVLDPISDQH